MGQSGGVGWVIQEILPGRRVEPWAAISLPISMQHHYANIEHWNEIVVCRSSPNAKVVMWRVRVVVTITADGPAGRFRGSAELVQAGHQEKS
jgi:hypothetical protein